LAIVRPGEIHMDEIELGPAMSIESIENDARGSNCTGMEEHH